MGGRCLVSWQSSCLYEALSCQGQNLHPRTQLSLRDHIAWLEQQDLTKSRDVLPEKLAGFTAPTCWEPIEHREVCYEWESHRSSKFQPFAAATAAQSFASDSINPTLNIRCLGPAPRYSEADIVSGDRLWSTGKP